MVTLRNENSFKFLRVVQDADLYGRDKADTTTIREAADLSRGEVHHQYETLEEKGLIEIERDPDATPDGKPAVKIAVLTEKAKEEIDKGLLVEAEKKYGADESEDVEEIAEEVASLRETLSTLETLPSEVESLETELESVESDLRDVEEMAKWTSGGSDSVEEERVEEVEEQMEDMRERWNTTMSPGLKVLYRSVARIEMALEDEGIDVTELEIDEVPDERVDEMISRSEQYISE